MTSALTLTWQDSSALLPEEPKQLDDWLEQLMERHQHRDYSLWLDSAAAEHSNSRYHVLLKDPVFFLQATPRGADLLMLDDTFSLASIAQQAVKGQPFLEAANTLLTTLAAKISVAKGPALPFNGGFAGYLSYDLGRQIERIPDTNAAEYETPFAGLGFYTTALIIDKHRHQLWSLAPSDAHSCLLAEWLDTEPESSAELTLTSGWNSNMNRTKYSGCFAQVKDYLTAGDCYQINLAQRFSASYIGSEWHAYCKLRRQNGAPFSAFMRLPTSAVLSVSPERFLAVDELGCVETKPIKGTRPRHSDAAADQQQVDALAASEKDRAENLMIVDLLRNDLSRSCRPGSIEVPQLFAIESFPAVHHLVSTVTGVLESGKTALDLFNGAFPGGSITGAPKVRAMEIIEQLEPNRRSVYCGSIAYFSLCGRSDSSITIRTLLAEAGQLYCWAGGGLVSDSEDEAEYQETLDKVARILPVLESS